MSSDEGHYVLDIDNRELAIAVVSALELVTSIPKAENEEKDEGVIMSDSMHNR